MRAKKVGCKEHRPLTVKQLNEQFHKLKEEVMAAIDNLNTAVQGLQTTVTAVEAAVTALKNQPNNDAAIQAAADSISTATASLNSAIQ